MAGYIGTKAVLLSTTAASVTGNADIGGDLTVDTSTLFVDSTNNRVGVGTSSPAVLLDVAGSSGQIFLQNTDATANGSHDFSVTALKPGTGFNNFNIAGYEVRFKIGGASTEAMRIDASGRLLVGKTATNINSDGVELTGSGFITGTVNGAHVVRLNRRSSDGDIIQFRKDNADVGSIGAVAGDLYIVTGDTGLRFVDVNDSISAVGANGAARDNAVDLGNSGTRFDDIYATNGTIQTSDRNEKQDIAELDEAERRVAVAAKGLLRKFRWKDAVAEKGDDARIHFGIIAQDLQAAFEAEGLDAGRYAMFISSTWWEADRVIPAVEAQDAVYETQLDEDGNEVQVLVSEAVEAQPEQVVTDTYETQAEAPEGAVERTRLGVRYPELLAFIIGAM